MKTIVLILVMIFAAISLISTVGLFWALDQRATGFEEGYRMGQFDASMGKYKQFDAWWNVSATKIGLPDTYVPYETRSDE